MVLGLFVVDLVGGTLVHARALSTAFHTQYSTKSQMNQAALFFALHNFAGSVVEAPSQHDLKYFETTTERYVLEPLPAKQWLLVIVTCRSTHSAIARHMATVIGAGEAVPMDRKRQAAYFHTCTLQALDAAISRVLQMMRERHAAELALVAFDSETVEVAPLTVSVATRSRWRRRWHTRLQRKATTKVQHGSTTPPGRRWKMRWVGGEALVSDAMQLALMRVLDGLALLRMSPVTTSLLVGGAIYVHSVGEYHLLLVRPLQPTHNMDATLNGLVLALKYVHVD